MKSFAVTLALAQNLTTGFCYCSLGHSLSFFRFFFLHVLYYVLAIFFSPPDLLLFRRDSLISRVASVSTIVSSLFFLASFSYLLRLNIPSHTLFSSHLLDSLPSLGALCLSLLITTICIFFSVSLVAYLPSCHFFLSLNIPCCVPHQVPPFIRVLMFECLNTLFFIFTTLYSINSSQNTSSGTSCRRPNTKTLPTSSLSSLQGSGHEPHYPEPQPPLLSHLHGRTCRITR